ncbi:MAG: exodeoxyribonuclease V subunit gamma [Halobacteriota archaeon]
MEKVNTSNSIEHLLGKLANDLKNSGGTTFTRTTMITQSSGMNSWLRTELANKNKIFANYQFLNQDGLFNALYKLAFGDAPKCNTDQTKYDIFFELNEAGFRNKFPNVCQYYEDDDLRRMQLAERMADLFDQYQLYRPGMIAEWEERRTEGKSEDEIWQKYLWNSIRPESRTRARESLLKALRENKELIQKQYPEIYVFGISIFTGFHRDFLSGLAALIDVHYYITLPAPDLPYSNEMLKNLGSKAIELAGMFKLDTHESLIPEKDTLLTKIQKSIITNSEAKSFLKDDSLVINACYTPAREAECLYNYLLPLFNSDRLLQPEDVLVLTPDINTYEPYIRAVFNNAPVKIPLRISGADNNTDDSMVAALEMLMTFTEEEMTSEKVVSMLEHKRIKKAFRIENNDYLRQIVRKANIRFGRENSLEDDTHYVSWKYGLEKIILGYAMLTDEEYVNHEGIGLYPFRDAEGSASYDLLRLKEFVNKLQMLLDACNVNRTPSEWKSFLLEDILDTMVHMDQFNKEDREELSSIYRMLSYTDRLENVGAIPYDAFLEELKTKLFTESQEVHLNTGNVTVTPPLPVRGIPAKIICFLGLNNGEFPRVDRFYGFDLMGSEYRIGDRSKLENDKFLFLDTLMAARDKLYLSYIGRNTKDNSETPPSIVVDALISFTGLNDITVEHPLHGFSTKYNADDPNLFTYLYGGVPVEFEAVKSIADETSEYSLRSFTRFFENPIQWYFNNILNIYYKEDDNILPETEIFNLDEIQKWKLREELVKVPEESLEKFRMKAVKEGILPLSNNARHTLQELNVSIAELKSQYNELVEGRTERSVHVEFSSGNTKIHGEINEVFESTLICYTVSSQHEKYKLRFYLKALMLMEKSEIDRAVFIDKKGNMDEVPMLEPGEAKRRIQDIIVYFEKGRKNPLLFSLNGALQVVKKSNTPNIFKDEIEGKYHYPPNPYISKYNEEGHLEVFRVEDYTKNDFEESIYEEPQYHEISKIASLLNIQPK